MTLKSLFGSALAAAGEHSPSIMTGLSIGGMLTAGILAVRATPEAERRIADAKRRLGKNKLTLWETVRAAFPCYIVPGLIFTAAGFVQIYAVSTLNTRVATATALYSMSEATALECKDVAKELFGERKAKELEDAVEKEITHKNLPTDQNVYKDHDILTTIQEGETLFRFDKRPGVYFYTDLEKVRRAINTCNARLAQNLGYDVTYNDLFAECNLPLFRPDEECYRFGEDLVWNEKTGFIEILDPPPVSEEVITFKDSGFTTTIRVSVIKFRDRHGPIYRY